MKKKPYFKILIICFIICLGINANYLIKASTLDTINPSEISLKYLFNKNSDFQPPLLKGLKAYPNNPLKFDFIIDNGSNKGTKKSLKNYNNLIKYFFCSLTINNRDLWVNLSPYEKNRIMPDNLAKTQMGRDLLEADYQLKKLTTDLLKPTHPLGKLLWKKINTTKTKCLRNKNTPLEIINKIWISPEKADVYLAKNLIFVDNCKLKVFIKDASEDNQKIDKKNIKNILNDILIPVIEKKVNYSHEFASLRQISYAMILANSFKNHTDNKFFNDLYFDKNKVADLGKNDGDNIENIYKKYYLNFFLDNTNLISLKNNPRIKQKCILGGYQYSPWIYTQNIINQSSLEELIDKKIYGEKITIPIEAITLWSNDEHLIENPKNFKDIKPISKEIKKIISEIIKLIEKTSPVIIKLKPSSFLRNTLIAGGDLDGLSFYCNLNSTPWEVLSKKTKKYLYQHGINIEEIKWVDLTELSKETELNPDQKSIIFYQTNKGFSEEIKFDIKDIYQIHWQARTKCLARMKILRLFSYLSHSDMLLSFTPQDSKQEIYVKEIQDFSQAIAEKKININEEEKLILKDLNDYMVIKQTFLELPFPFDLTKYPTYQQSLKNLIKLGLIMPSLDNKGLYLIWHMAYPSFDLTPGLIPLNQELNIDSYNLFNQWQGGDLLNDSLKNLDHNDLNNIISFLGTPSAVKTWFAYLWLENFIKNKGEEEIIEKAFSFIKINKEDRLFSNQHDIQRAMILRALSQAHTPNTPSCYHDFIYRLINTVLVNDPNYGYSLKYLMDIIKHQLIPEANHTLTLTILNKFYPLLDSDSPFTRSDAWNMLSYIENRIKRLSTNKISEFYISLKQFLSYKNISTRTSHELTRIKNSLDNILNLRKEESYLALTNNYQPENLILNTQQLNLLKEALKYFQANDINYSLKIKNPDLYNRVIASNIALRQLYDNLLSDIIVIPDEELGKGLYFANLKNKVALPDSWQMIYYLDNQGRLIISESYWRKLSIFFQEDILNGFKDYLLYPQNRDGWLNRVFIPEYEKSIELNPHLILIEDASYSSKGLNIINPNKNQKQYIESKLSSLEDNCQDFTLESQADIYPSISNDSLLSMLKEHGVFNKILIIPDHIIKQFLGKNIHLIGIISSRGALILSRSSGEIIEKMSISNRHVYKHFIQILHNRFADAQNLFLTTYKDFLADSLATGHIGYFAKTFIKSITYLDKEKNQAKILLNMQKIGEKEEEVIIIARRYTINKNNLIKINDDTLDQGIDKLIQKYPILNFVIEDIILPNNSSINKFEIAGIGSFLNKNKVGICILPETYAKDPLAIFHEYCHIAYASGILSLKSLIDIINRDDSKLEFFYKKITKIKQIYKEGEIPQQIFIHYALRAIQLNNLPQRDILLTNKIRQYKKTSTKRSSIINLIKNSLYNNSEKLIKLYHYLRYCLDTDIAKVEDIKETKKIFEDAEMHKWLIMKDLRKRLFDFYNRHIKDRLDKENILRVLQLNQLMGITPDRLQLMINYLKKIVSDTTPNIITLQETTHKENFDSAMLLAKAINYQCYQVPYRNIKDFQEGLAILYHPSLQLEKNFSKVIKIIEKGELKDTRLVIGVKLHSIKTNRDYYVFNTHLSGHPACDGWRKYELEEIANYISSVTKPESLVIFSGDFNYATSKEFQQAKVLLKNFTDSFQEVYPKTRGYTYSPINPLVEFPGKRLDIIYVKSFQQTVGSNILLDFAPYCTDHFALMSDLSIQDKANWQPDKDNLLSLFNNIWQAKILPAQRLEEIYDLLAKDSVGGIYLNIYQDKTAINLFNNKTYSHLPLKGLSFKINKIIKNKQSSS